MFIKRFSLSVGLCGVLLATSALAVNNPADLLGYTEGKASPAFTQYLVNNDSAFIYFAEHTSTLQFVMDNPTLQADLVSGKITPESLDKDDDEDSLAADDLETVAGAGVRDDISFLADNNLRNSHSSNNKIDVGKDVDKLVNGPIRTIRDPNLKDPNIRRGNDTLGPVTNPVVPVPKPIDMNALPADALAKDANGWPKYLNVPASCPKPEAGTKYLHDFAFGDPRPGGTANEAVQPQWSVKNNAVSPWFKRLGSWFYLSMTDAEAYAVPFYSGYLAQPDFPYAGDGVGGKLRFDWEAGGGIQTTVGAPEFEVSECPGKFIKPGDMPTKDPKFLGYGGYGRLFMYKDDFDKAYAAAAVSSQAGLQSMRLEPGKRYFLNVRQGNRNCDQIAPNAAKRDGHSVCANVVVSNGTDFYGMRSRPPYAGPCLSQGPYPANYDSKTCQENLPSCGEDYKLDSVRIICQDALGKAPEQKYEASCVSGKLRWTQGAGKPGFDSYVCVGDWHQKGMGDAMSWEAMPTYKLCSRENEGGKRSLQAITKRGETPTVVAELKQTCVFDEKETAGIYRWKEVSSSMSPNLDWNRMYQRYDDYTIKSFWYDKEGNLAGSNTTH